MLLVFIILFCVIVALGLGGLSAWSDFNKLLIPNMYVILIGAVFVPAFLLANFFAPEAGFFGSWKSHLFSGAFMFAVTYALFYFKMIGGGDSKMLSVFALWAGVKGLMPLLFFMAVVGGMLGAVTLYLNKKKLMKEPAKDGWIAKAQSGAKDVPYGIAIFVGAVFAFWHAGYIQPGELMALASQGGELNNG